MKIIILILLLFLPNQVQAGEFFQGDSIGECRAVIAELDTEFGYPNPATNTDTYAKPILHAGRLGKCLVYLKWEETDLRKKGVWMPRHGRRATMNDFRDRFTINQWAKRKDLATLKSEGAFPVESRP